MAVPLRERIGRREDGKKNSAEIEWASPCYFLFSFSLPFRFVSLVRSVFLSSLPFNLSLCLSHCLLLTFSLHIVFVFVHRYYAYYNSELTLICTDQVSTQRQCFLLSLASSSHWCHFPSPPSGHTHLYDPISSVTLRTFLFMLLLQLSILRVVVPSWSLPFPAN